MDTEDKMGDMRFIDGKPVDMTLNERKPKTIVLPDNSLIDIWLDCLEIDGYPEHHTLVQFLQGLKREETQ
jgi:hypothetical protein